MSILCDCRICVKNIFPSSKWQRAGWEIRPWFIRDRRFSVWGMCRFLMYCEEFGYKEKCLIISLSSFCASLIEQNSEISKYTLKKTVVVARQVYNLKLHESPLILDFKKMCPSKQLHSSHWEFNIRRFVLLSWLIKHDKIFISCHFPAIKTLRPTLYNSFAGIPHKYYCCWLQVNEK